MQYVRCPVATLAVGQAASMASLLLASGEAGHRRSLPHSRVMLHQPSGGASGQASDIWIHAQEILKTRDMLNSLYVRHTGQDKSRIGEGGVHGSGPTRWPGGHASREWAHGYFFRRPTREGGGWLLLFPPI